MVIANAGVMATPFGHTADGFETQFGTNHLGHFVFVNRIASLIREGGRVINLASSGHRFANVDLKIRISSEPRTTRSSHMAARRRRTYSFPSHSTHGHRGRGFAPQRSIPEVSKQNSAVT